MGLVLSGCRGQTAPCRNMKNQLYQRVQPPEGTVDALDGSHAYRLKSWPEIPEPYRTARVLRACSRMTLGPVTANWFLSQTGLDPAGAIRLMSILIDQGTVERIDLGPRARQSATTRTALSTEPRQRIRLRLRIAQRLARRPAAVVALFCLAMAAAVDHPVPIGPIALPDLPVISG